MIIVFRSIIKFALTLNLSIHDIDYVVFYEAILKLHRILFSNTKYI